MSVKAAIAHDPRVKLSFTDHERDGKVFLFTSTDVKESVKSFCHNQPFLRMMLLLDRL